MDRMTRFYIGLFLALTLVAGVTAGCGESLDDDQSAAENATQNDENQQNDDAPPECEDGQVWHPVTEECTEQSDNDDNDDNGDNNDDNGDNDDVNDVNDVNDDNTDEEECGPGGIAGQTCRPDGGILPGAQVVVEGVDCDGDVFSTDTTADGEGFYNFSDVPSGDHEMTITSGSFEVESEVTVVKDQVTDLESTEDAKVCLQGDEVDIAVFPGSLDDPGVILDGMGVDYDGYSGGFSLGPGGTDLIFDLDALMEYDILFIGCQVDEPMDNGAADEIAMANLRKFVEDGNSVYASDRAHPWIYQSMPDAIPFELEYDPDDDPGSIRSSIQTGSPGGVGGFSTTYVADVASAEMLSWLGTTTVEFVFDTTNWTIVSESDLGPTATAHFTLDPEISTGGSGTYDGASAVTTYDDPIGDGRVIYTSFHNSEQVTDDMEEILDYMVFQL